MAPRTTPTLTQLFTIDKTGEKGWPFGAEDVAGDGADNFKAAEQSIDIRTGYAATDANRLWIRLYVSAATKPAANVTAFVFIDNDRKKSTGGSAADGSIDPKLIGADPTGGGYDVVLTLHGDGTFGPLWTWNKGQKKFVSSMIKMPQGVASAGVDVDPILLDGDRHGFLQGAVDFNLVGVDETCAASFYVRSVSTAGGDRDVGSRYACVPDLDDNGVPDIVIPPTCTTGEECPNHGFCIGGHCYIPAPCMVDTDCKGANQRCDDGRCVPKGGADCQGNEDCDGLVCKGGKCVACTLGGDECGDGETCAPNGECVKGTPTGEGGGDITIPPGGGVRGGACACRTAEGHGEEAPLASLAAAVGIALARARRSRRPTATRTKGQDS